MVDNGKMADMNVYGLDFTSRPSRLKAITCAKCQLDGDRLVVDYLQRLESLDAFGAFLDSPGPWIAGIDFPFGQPRRLVENLNWPGSWAGYVAHVAGLSREGFRGVLKTTSETGPKENASTCALSSTSPERRAHRNSTASLWR